MGWGFEYRVINGSQEEDQRAAQEMEQMLSVLSERVKKERENQKIIDGSLEREEKENERVKALLSGMIKRSESD